MSDFAVMPLKDYIDACDAIRSKTASTEVIKSGEIPKKISEVYEAGKKSEYDRFWDIYQNYGNRTNYTTAFGSCWNKELFKPKYDIRPTSAYYMFYNNIGAVIDLGECAEDYFEELGIVLDYSKATYAHYGVAALHAKRFKKLDFSSATSLIGLFYSHNQSNTNSVEVIDEFVSSEITTYSNDTFGQAIFLREIRFSGVIAKNISFNNCSELTKESLDSIISVLKDFSGTTTTATLTLHATAKAKLTEADIAIATQKGWTIA